MWKKSVPWFLLNFVQNQVHLLSEYFQGLFSSTKYCMMKVFSNYKIRFNVLVCMPLFFFLANELSVDWLLFITVFKPFDRLIIEQRAMRCVTLFWKRIEKLETCIELTADLYENSHLQLCHRKEEWRNDINLCQVGKTTRRTKSPSVEFL